MVSDAITSYTNAITLLNLGSTMSMSGSTISREEIDISSLLSGRDSKLSDLYLNRGVCYMNAKVGIKDLNLAIRDLNAAAEYKGRPSAVVLVNRGICRDYLGDYLNAASDFGVAERLGGGMAGGGTAGGGGGKAEPWYLRYVHCLVETGEEKDAKRIWRELYERFPEVEEVRAFGVVLFGDNKNGGEGKGEGYLGDFRKGPEGIGKVVKKVKGKGGWGKVSRGRMEEFLKGQDDGDEGSVKAE
ncbi:hypothetical protein TrCOL_g2950 [Triparma columacea]|uniref:Uncharacterized protein n=1 Tax=Triparma columacea TaxID=722753 RepID=A0A9W7L634_9STRA|nr:hypothetical protein TrCOL_g2950 [Triparma columacea]